MLSSRPAIAFFLALVSILGLSIGAPTERDDALPNLRENSVARDTSMLPSAWGWHFMCEELPGYDLARCRQATESSDKAEEGSTRLKTRNESESESAPSWILQVQDCYNLCACNTQGILICHGFGACNIHQVYLRCSAQGQCSCLWDEHLTGDTSYLDNDIYAGIADWGINGYSSHWKARDKKEAEKGQDDAARHGQAHDDQDHNLHK